MEFIISALSFIILVLLLIIVRRNSTIRILRGLDEYNNKTLNTLKSQIKVEKTNYQDLIDEIKEIESRYKKYLLLILSSNVKVYTQSNFYTNHSFFNGRFYAKINNKDKNNKAEGIPVIDIPNNKNAVLNLYDLSYILRNNSTSDIEASIQDSIILKEVLIGELGNKSLKPYKR